MSFAATDGADVSVGGAGWTAVDAAVALAVAATVRVSEAPATGAAAVSAALIHRRPLLVECTNF